MPILVNVARQLCELVWILVLVIYCEDTGGSLFTN